MVQDLTSFIKKEQEPKAKAHELAKKQREIGVAEFFSRNRHLLGFDNKRKALLTTIKEAVDNSLDACEEAHILPEINIQLIEIEEEKYKIIVEDNGPGIVRNQIPKIFAKLLYGSKFHSLKQSRGQQGIGISASVMYGQMTTGKPAKITSKIAKNQPAHYYELHINTQKNKEEIVKSQIVEWEKDQGTKIEIDLEGSYQLGQKSVDEYLKQTSITNPHATIIYTNPKAKQIIFPRVTEKLPKDPKETKPHPYGVELGTMIKMLQSTDARTLQAFLTREFTRVGSGTAKRICENAVLLPNTKPKSMSREMSDQLMKGIKKTKLMKPPTDCVSPIKSELFEKGLKRAINAEFYCSSTRPPSVYRGNPFVVEAAIAYGGEQPSDKSIRLLRFANRVPLIHQQSAGSIAKAAIATTWRNYGLSQSSGALPIGPLTLAVHIASVWVPFTSESKEAIAHYPEIIKEIRLAIQECGRKLGQYIHKKKRVGDEIKKRGYIEKYIPHVADALIDLLSLPKSKRIEIERSLKKMLEEQRGKVESMEFKKEKNIEYDKEFADIGKNEE
jgi:DNA topoisomerase-6 subunit B